jgi:L-ascorbate metabolism protein UlaG (beta-lactamase superfamily)
MGLNRYHLILVSVALIVALGVVIWLKMPFLPEQLIKSPADALDERIVKTPPGSSPESRRDLLLGFDDFVSKYFPTVVTTQGEVAKLLELRTRRAIEEIRSASVPSGSMRVWYIYNMGVVIKTVDATIGIDVAGTYAAPSIADVGGLLDVLLVTHPHGDHLDAKVTAAAAKAGAKIVVADERVRIDYSNQLNIVRDPGGESMVKVLTGSSLAAQALVGVEPGGTIEVKGVRITAYPAEHRYPNRPITGFEATPTDWLYVEASGFGILHTGDGTFTGSKPDLSGKRVDLYLIHYVDEICAEDYYELAPQSRVMVPLHLHELGHGREILDYAMFSNALGQERDGDLWLSHMTPQDTGMRYVPLVWGESVEMSINP